jgi:LPS-assembly protein
VAAGLGRAIACTFAVAAALAVASPQTAHAQDPSARSKGQGPTNESAFAKPKGGMFGPVQKKFDDKLPLYLQGDQLVYDTKGNRVIARGNVEIFYDDNQLTADEVIYDQGASTLNAVGNVVLKEKNGNIVRAERYTLTDDFRDGFVQALSVVSKDESRITAERAERREGNVTQFSNATFTACKSDSGMPPLWCIGAAKITHDQAGQTIYYQDAQFKLFGQPVFYMPYFEHPDPTVKRRSGFLPPEYRQSGDLGFGVEIPYYFALAPNYDFTFHPAYLSKQGVLYQGIWRHKFDGGQYIVKGAVIDQDADQLPRNNTNSADLDGLRGSIETAGEYSISSWWKAGWNATIESDDTFRRFYKLDNILVTDRVNSAYVVGQSERSYLGATMYQFGGLLTNDTPQSESYVHPIIDYNYVFADPVLGGELRWDSNALSFSRQEGDVLRRDESINKITSELKWRRRFTDTFGITYTPFGELRGDIYQLNNYTDPVTSLSVSDETIVRGRASAGVTVAYPWVANTRGGAHVIEPIGQIVTREDNVSQRDLPDEDAKSLVFDDTNLFETDKFSGFDRLETGTRVNAGLQYTFQANSGGSIRILAGESFHLSGTNAYADPGTDTDGRFVYSPTSGLETDRSDYVLGLYVAPIETFRVLSQSRFDEGTGELRREDLSARFYYGPLTTQATYTYAAADPARGIELAQQDIVGQIGLQLTDRWSVTGGMRYDIANENRLLDSVQIRYLDECFMLSATYQETFINDPTRDIAPDRTVMLRFEFKNLGGFKYKTDVLDYTFGADQKPGSIE